MTKNNRNFSWKTTRDEEIGFHFEHDDLSSRNVLHGEGSTPPPSDARNEGRSDQIQVNQYTRSEVYNNRMQANDELYIAPQEHSGMILTSDLFDGKNFHSWTRAVKRGLFARNKLGFVDCNLREPPEGSIDHMQWVKTDYIVFNWISNSVVKEISRGLHNLETFRQLWQELHKRFRKRNGPRIYKLCRNIATFTQHNQTVLVYFNSLCALWDELDLLNISRSCVCEASEDAKAEMEEKRMMEFFMGLNDAYESIRQQILIINPLSTVSQTYGMVLQVDEQMLVNNQFPNGREQSALYNNSKQGGYMGDEFKRRLTKEEKKKLKCDNCGATGHLRADCFELHGIPEWYKKFKAEKGKYKINNIDDKGILSSRQGESIVKKEEPIQPDIGRLIQTEIAKQLASYVKQGGQVDGGSSSANVAHIGGKDLRMTTMDFDGHFAFGISTEITKNEWIVDSGANNHMCCQTGLLTNVNRLENPLKIFLPDESSLWAFLIGDAQITTSIKLTEVLYAPDFTHNLISVGQLTKGIDGKVIFLSTHCIVQKKHNEVVLGVGRMKGTIYVFKQEYQFTVTINTAVQQQCATSNFGSLSPKPRAPFSNNHETHKAP